MERASSEPRREPQSKELMMIPPTVGRVVWFWPHRPLSPDEQPWSASVAYVHSERMINVGGFDSMGVPFNRGRVQLLQNGDLPPEHHAYCTWMPYQKGQAAKTEALEAAARGAGAPQDGEAPGHGQK